jgi:hypothetical protein
LHDRVEVPEPVTLVGVRVQVRPVEGEADAARPTTPLNPCKAVTVIVEVPETPARTVTVVGFDAKAKSWTVYAAVAE